MRSERSGRPRPPPSTKPRRPRRDAARTAGPGFLQQRGAHGGADFCEQRGAPGRRRPHPREARQQAEEQRGRLREEKKSEKEQAAARRKSKHEAYHTRVRDVLQANKAAQPLGDVDAATGACACPKNIFCAKCPAEKYAQAKRTIEATELLFHDATNVGCGMELADADLDDLIEKCVKVTDARKIELGKAYDKKIGLGIPLPVPVRPPRLQRRLLPLRRMPDAPCATTRRAWQALDQTIESAGDARRAAPQRQPPPDRELLRRLLRQAGRHRRVRRNRRRRRPSPAGPDDDGLFVWSAVRDAVPRVKVTAGRHTALTDRLGRRAIQQVVRQDACTRGPQFTARNSHLRAPRRVAAELSSEPRRSPCSMRTHAQCSAA